MASIAFSTMFVAEHQLELHLGQEVDDIFGAAIKLGMAFLASETLGLGHRDALEADLLQSLLNFIELEWLDDRFDLFHAVAAPPMDAKCRLAARFRP